MADTAKSELFDKIAQIYANLTPKKKRVADFILSDYKNLFLMNAKELAAKCGVSEPTVLRFVTDLGFSSYPHFEQYVKGLLHIELTSVERLLRATTQNEISSTLDAYARNTVNNLENLVNSISQKDLRQVAEKIKGADTVLVAGYRASQTLASYFGYLLRKVRSNVLIDTSFSTDIMDQIALNGPSILMVLLSFPRYPQQVVEFIKYAKSFNVSVLGVSDTPKSPIVGLADHYVVIDMAGLSFVDPFAHIITYLGALIHEISFVDKDATLKRLKHIEKGVKTRGEFYSEDGTDGIDPDNPLGMHFYRPDKKFLPE